MSFGKRPIVAAALVAVGCAFATAACGAGGPEVQTDGTATTSGDVLERGAAAPTDRAPAVSHGDTSGSGRSEPEQEFLGQLSALGVPTDMTADTTVEVGIGICRGLADGVETETILDRIRPLSSAIAAHHAELDSAGVGRAIVDASRAHLCG